MEPSHVSVAFDVNFHKPIRCGENLYALVKLNYKNQQLLNLGCDVFNESGELDNDASHAKSMGP